ncbi:MAG: hypothetical protein LBQ24_00755 [Candidatus Peribacteria bacterium]|jgi:hypothetical protein|nr:hypothetical protein [Candidatus Peribacteria bacterium]
MTSLRKDIAMGTLKLTVQEKEDAEKVISRLGKCYDLIDNNKPFANSGDYVLFYLWYTGNEARQDIKNYFIDVNFELREKYLLEKI